MREKDATGHLRGWKIVAENAEPGYTFYFESVMTLGNGYLGVRGSREEAKTTKLDNPLTLIAEAYDRPRSLPGVPRDYSQTSRLAPAPNPLSILFNDGTGTLSYKTARVLSETQTLDMKRGALERRVRFKSKGGCVTSIVSRRIVSQARPHLIAIRYAVTPENYSGPVTLTSLLDASVTYPDGLVQTKVLSKGREGDTVSMEVKTFQTRTRIAEAARHRLSGADEAKVAEKTSEKKTGLTWRFDARRGKTVVLEKVVALMTSVREENPLAAARAAAAGAPNFAALECEHAAAWAEYWRDCDVKITGDRLVQTMARFFVFQLLQAASKNNVKLGLRASIPAKTMSGPGYNGHIFWDTEIYMLPFFAQQYPEISRSLLTYRHDRMDAARKNAAASGCDGLKFPWESADTGREECPKWLPNHKGGYWRWWGAEQQLHVNADVAFGFWEHYLATGDARFLMGPGLDVIAGTARYWASRVKETKVDGKAVYELRKVIGPDEHHDHVNNSVYTNAMVRWNIRKALDLVAQLRRTSPARYRAFARKHGLTAKELRRWRHVADRIKINFDDATGLYEQFDGYFKHPVQEIKQADVLLMLYQHPEMRTTEIFRRNFDRYHPVTLHGSSLSPGVHVLFALDVGYKDKAYEYEAQACCIDGKQRIGGSDSGLHAAALGGGWGSIVAGFGGVRVMPDCLRVAPDLPRHWKRLEFSMRYKGLRIRFTISRTRLLMQADRDGRAVTVDVLGTRRRLKPGGRIERKLG